ncbi:MAG: hypothetical protein JXR30_01290 [Alphaproteobacteria bacterium]|nr:hypothetical protein [Alphaproteobacteria bacterium]
MFFGLFDLDDDKEKKSIEYDATGRIKRTWTPIHGEDADSGLVKEMRGDAKFKKAMKKTSVFEGGYSLNPNDPGGETQFGITKRWYPNEDIKGITKERAEYILFRDYYKKPGIDRLPNSIRDQVFDNAVNQGQGTAIRNLQRAVGVKQDGLLGSKTLSRVKETPSLFLRENFKRSVQNRYEDIFNKNPTFEKTYGNGLRRRVRSY